MQRPICWIERGEDGTRREVRVTILRDQVKWQFKADSDERWDYSSMPSLAEWDNLLTRVENRYHRRAIKHGALTLVQCLAEKARASV